MATAEEVEAAGLADQVRGFLSRHSEVRVWEEGRVVARMGAADSGYALHAEGGKLVAHFWTPEANLVRRLVGAGSVTGGRLRLQSLRMGKAKATPLVLEAGGGEDAARRVARGEFREAVIGAAERDWPGWRLEAGGAQGGSGAQRLVFRRQNMLAPCVAVDGGESAGVVEGALAQGLIWAREAAARWPRRAMAGLRLILPPGADAAVGWRLRWLRDAVEVYRLDRSAGRLERVEMEGRGNLQSHLRRAAGLPPEGAAAAALLEEIREYCPQARLEVGSGGQRVFRVYGLEIACQTEGAEALVARFAYGCGREKTPLVESARPLWRRFLERVGRERVPGGDRRDPLYAMQPERWMEHLLRADLERLEPACDPRFVYAQVPVCAPGQRDVLDLLAVDRGGRLLVLELKADEDAGFPLQALDYWMRVRHHQEAGDFTRLGYFPGVELSPAPPRLWLVAPALRWHPRTAWLVEAIAPEVPLERIGINEEWRQGIQIVTRWASPPS